MQAILLGLSIILVGAGGSIPIPLWQDGPPDSNGITEPEKDDNGFVSNVSVPELAPYLPPAEKATGAAVLICPGGGYRGVAMDHEGRAVGEWLNSFGVAGFALKYRMPNGHHDIPLQDSQQALKIIRSRASEWGIDPARVGVMGFSAGGHLASTVGTHFATDLVQDKGGITEASVRPDFMILIYPVITMGIVTHGGSRNNLLGENASEELLKRFSNELRVSEKTPPTFIVFSNDDEVVPPENAIRFYEALHANKIPVELHIFERGGHGYGLGSNDIPASAWPGLCETWLRQLGVLKAP